MADKMIDEDGNGIKIDSADKATALVSRVIHEYDVIDENESNSGHKCDLTHPQNREASVSQRRGNNSDGQSESSQEPIQGIKQMRIEQELDYKDSDSNNSLDDNLETICPRVNTPEKIVICLDLSEEMDKVTFRSRAGDKWTTLRLVKRALRLFLHSKSKINKQHEYALVILQEQAIWMRDFTNNPRDIIGFLEEVEGTFECGNFDLSALFDVIRDNVDLPQVEGDPSVIAPPYTVRVLLLYGRSQCPIDFSKKEVFRHLDSSPYFCVDALYIHEQPSEDNKCEKIFDTICDLDEKETSYIFSARNPTKLYDEMAQLLAHPLQRPLQREVAYRLLNMADIETILPV